MFVNRITSSILLAIMLLMSFGFFVSSVSAQSNPTINYQGKLTDSLGVAVADGTYNMRFFIYNAVGVATTSAIWTEELTGSDQVQVTNGLFSVMLGSTTPLTSVDFNQPLYLGVEIGGSGAIAWDGEMSPRKNLGTVPAAFESYKVGGVASSSFLRSDATDTASGLLTFTGGLISNASTTIGSGTAGGGLTISGNSTTTGDAYFASGLSIGTTSAWAELVVDGDAMISGGLYDNNYTRGNNGEILQTTGSGIEWVSTSSLGIVTTDDDLSDNSIEDLQDVSSMTKAAGNLLSWSGSAWTNVATSTLGLGNGSFLGLSDTPGSYNFGRLLFSDNSSIVDSVNLTFSSSTLRAPTFMTSGGVALGAGMTREEVWSNSIASLEGLYGLTANTANFQEVVAPSVFESASTDIITAVAMKNGNTFVTYQDIGNSNYGTFVIYDSAGNEVVAPTVFNSSTTAYISPTVLQNGNIIIGYQDDGNSDRGTFVIYDSLGNLLVSPTVFETGTAEFINTTPLLNGNVLIAYRDSNNSSFGSFVIYGPTGDEVVPTTVFDNVNTHGMSVTTLQNGNVFIAYRDQSNSNAGTFVVFDPAGNQVVAPTVFNASLANFGVSADTLQNGNVVISYINNSNQGAIVIYDPSGNEVVAQTVVATDPYDFIRFTLLSATALPNGHILIAYQDDANSERGTFVIYDQQGNQISEPKVFETGATTDIDVTTLQNGNVFIAYRDGGNSGHGTFVIYGGSGTTFSDSLAVETKDEVGYNLFSVTGSTTATATAITQLGTGDIFTLNNATSRLFTATNNGNVGIGSTSPSSKLTVAGDTYIGGALTATGTITFSALTSGLLTADASGILSTTTIASSSLAVSNWTNGYVLQASTTASGGIEWVSTSSLGIVTTDDDLSDNSIEDLQDVSSMTKAAGNLLSWSGSAWTNVATSTLGLGNGSFLGLSDTPGSFTTSAIPFVSGGALSFNSTFVYDGTNLGIGTASPGAMLDIFGVSNSLRLSYDGSTYNEFSTNSSGELVINSTGGSDSSIILGSGIAEDLLFGFDGNALDYYFGVDDSTDTFTLGTGLTMGASAIISIESASTTIFNAFVSSSTATSTFANGIQLEGGCFQDASGECIGGGGDTVVTVAASDTAANEKAMADYVADGVNDEDTIQAAIDYAYNGGQGGTVYLLSGQFNIASSSIQLATSSRLIGQGSSTILRLVNNAELPNFNGMITANQAHYTYVAHLNLLGNRVNNVIGDNSGIDFNNTATSTIDQVTANDFDYYGFLIQGESSNNTLIGNKANNNLFYGFFLQAGPNNNLLTNNTASNNGDFGFILFANSNNNTLTSNTASNNGDSGFFIQTSSNNNTFTNNTASNNSNSGFQLFSNSHNNTLSSNRIDGNSTHGIDIDDSHRTSLTNNYLYQNGGGVAGRYAIFINDNSDDTLISGNTLSATGTAPLIFVEQVASERTTIVGNTYINSDTTTYITDNGADTRYNEWDRTTITTDNARGYNLFSITGSTTATATAITQLGTGDIFTLNNASGRVLTIDNAGDMGIAGNVSIGSTSPLSSSRLSIQNLLGASGTGIYGIDQRVETANSVLDAVQAGNRFYLDASDNTATTTILGGLYQVADNTIFGNTVRGLEVQTNQGSNTLGENTAIAGFGRTFGIRGVTSGDAGGTFEPAGGFFETEGTTQGNAIRGFSDTITTANLMSLFHSSSSFEGTGLEMNFGNGAGDFASSSSRFLDFLNAGTSVFSVSAFGSLSADGIFNFSSTTATSTIAGGLSVGAINQTGSATSTFANGINLSGGCFSVGGTCISGGGASTLGALTDVDTTNVASGNLLVFNGSSWATTSTSSLNIAIGDTVVTVAASDTPANEKAMADYVADGSNDQETIELALASLPAHGGTVQLLSGTFSINDEINITQASTTLVGEGSATVLVVTATSTDWSVVAVDSTSNVRIANLVVDGSAAIAGWQEAVEFYRVSTSTAENIAINDMRASGLLIWESSHNLITGNTVNGAANGIRINKSHSNRISNNNLYDSWNGISFTQGSFSNIVADNYIEGSSYAIDLYQARYTTVTGNVLKKSSTYGIVIGNSGAYGNTITGNTISDGNYGIHLNENTSNNNISDNILHNNGGGTIASIYLTSTNDNIISGNNITATGSAALIQVANSASNRNIISNNIYDNSSLQDSNFISDAGTGTRYNDYNRRTLGTANTVGYNLLSITGSTTATATAITQLGTGDIFTLNNAASRVLTVSNNGKLGIGTNSPSSKLTVWGDGVGTGTRVFEIADSASTTIFAVNDMGSILATGPLTISSTTGTSTFANGINLTGGCFSVGGTCISGGGASTLGALTDVDTTNAVLGDLLTYNGSSWATTSTSSLGITASAGSLEDLTDVSSMTKNFGDLLYWNGSAWADLATSSLNINSDNVVEGSTNLFSQWDNVSGGINFAGGDLGIGSSTPSSRLSVDGDVWLNSNTINLSSSSASGLNIRYNTFATSTILNNSAYAWTLATSTNDTPIFRIDTSGTYANTSVTGGFDVNNGAISYNATNNQTSIENLQLGNMNFADDAGIVSWINMNVTASSATSTVLSYSAQLDGNSLLTIYGIADGQGGVGTTSVGIGTTSPSSKLSLQNLGFNGTGVVGLDQYLQTENSVESAVQYGNRYYLHASNTATTTIVGSIYRIEDNTDFANTVRGLEVQTNKGINTQGENTALSGFARTFGVRGITSGDAGGSFEPAGGFFETEGTTQGNAIRGFSDSITTATLLSLFQSSSTFDGTGLEMNFGNGGTGDFSSTTSKYLDFQNAGVSVFNVSAFGTTTIGRNDFDTTNLAGLIIGYGGICIDNDGNCKVDTAGRINSVSQATGNSDLAEMYFSSTDLEPGEIVTLSGGLSIDRANKDSETPIIGVVSTKPGLTLGFDDTSLVEGEEGYPVALSGRVPVKLSTENGPIKKGDSLMLSSLPGVAMKAKGTGVVIGTALEDFDDSRMYSETFINQFGDDMVDPQFAPVFSPTDPRIHDGCYYSGGAATGEEPCVPLVSTTTDAQIDEANVIIESESVAEALEGLRQENSETINLGNGESVKMGQIVMFVHLSHRWADEDQLAAIGVLTGTSSITNIGNNKEETVFDRLLSLANSFVDGVLSIFEIKVNRIEVADELCVDGVCINADDLRTILNSQAEQVSSTGSTEPVDPVNETGSTTGGGVQTEEETTEPITQTDNTSSTSTEQDVETSTSTTSGTTTNESTAEETSTPEVVGDTSQTEPEVTTEPSTLEEEVASDIPVEEPVVEAEPEVVVSEEEAVATAPVDDNQSSIGGSN